MKRNISALGTNETIVAENNHFMLIDFLESKNLPEDEFYDVVALGYINGIKKYCRRLVTEGYTLSDTVFKEMNKAYNDHLRNNDAPERKAIVYSISDYVNGYQTYEDVIADSKNEVESLISRLSVEETLKSFDKKQREILCLLMDGYRYSEIAKMLNMSVNALMFQIRAICERAEASSVLLAA